MPVTVEWDNEEKTVIRFDYDGAYTWEDVYNAMDKSNKMMETVEHSVAHIIDVRKAGSVPPNALSHARRIEAKTHPRRSYHVTVGANTFVRVMFNTFTKLKMSVSAERGLNYFTSSIDEARAWIAEQQAQTETKETSSS